MTSFPRSAGTARGDARRQALLTAVADDVAVHGLVDFSLRRAARAAGTTHKVLLYHFRDADDLLAQVVATLRARRIARGTTPALARAADDPAGHVRALWEVLVGSEETALVQAMGLAVYDPDRHAGLVQGSGAEYLATLTAMFPDDWTPSRRAEVAQFVLAALRGLLLARRTGAADEEVAAGLAALGRAVAREVAAPS